MHCSKGIRTNEDGCFFASCECNEDGEGTSSFDIYVGVSLINIHAALKASAQGHDRTTRMDSQR